MAYLPRSTSLLTSSSDVYQRLTNVRQLAVEDMARFDFYARRVRVLVALSANPDGYSSHNILDTLHYIKGSPLLPHLRSFFFYSPEPSCRVDRLDPLHFASCIVPPCLQELGLEFTTEGAIDNASHQLNKLARACLDIQRARLAWRPRVSRSIP